MFRAFVGVVTNKSKAYFCADDKQQLKKQIRQHYFRS